MAGRRYTLTRKPASRGYKIDYERELNPEQLEVVKAGGGPLLVLAGAGSGKTRALIYRVARLLEDGVAPDQILLLTFTNRAAREMVGRAGELVGEALGHDISRLWGGTFHAMANRILRTHGHHLGYNERFGILDQEDAAELITACVAELGYAQGPTRFPKAKVLLNLVSATVSRQLPLADLIQEERPQFARLTDEILEVSRRYLQRKRELNLMDFDDLLLNWKVLLIEQPEVKAALSGQFRHVLVDEYQDTNRLQGDIVDLMASAHGNLMVVGDDAQSIYSFRGAHFENILEFPQRHSQAQVFHLNTNYRSTPEILCLANASIAHNERQFPKTLSPVRPEGLAPALVPCRDVSQQADFVAQRLLELRDEGVALNEIAVLYRAHYHSMELQVELHRRGIPFEVRSGLRFFEQAHIKDVLSFLRFVANPTDELAFKRGVRLQPGVGAATAEKLWRWLREGAAGPLAQLKREGLAEQAPPRARPGVRRYAEFVTYLARPSRREQPGELLRAVLREGGYKDLLHDSQLNADSRVEDIEQLSDFADGYSDLYTFLSEIGLLTELESEEVVEGSEPDEQLTLSTIHKAKGLEWRAVFLIWLADGRFPVPNAYRSLSALEEERRLFYVAATRARDELYLCYPITHTSREGGLVVMKASPFVEELPGPGGDPPFEKWLLDEAEVAPDAPSVEAGDGPTALPSEVERTKRPSGL